MVFSEMPKGLWLLKALGRSRRNTSISSPRGGFPKLGDLFGDPHNNPYNILGSILGSPYFGKLPRTFDPHETPIHKNKACGMKAYPGV